MKIFVTLGSSTQNFNRLLGKIDELIDENIFKDVAVQSNSSDYVPKNYKIKNHLNFDEYEKFVKDCDILITHGGVGSIFDGLINNKKIIAFPRMSEYREAVNDHQKQIVDKFYNEGYILTGKIDELDKLITNIEKFNPKKYKSNNKMFNTKLIDIIEKL